jgi:endonuclease G, mitochondrial
VLPEFLHYQTDTAPGSSGSPVFNDQWEVVALHHSGVPKRDRLGQILSVNGTIWTNDQGEQNIAWIANEGVRISRIVKHIQRQRLEADAKQFRDQLFEEIPYLPLPSQVTPMANIDPLSANFSGAIASDGTVTWTIPLQVSVKLGQPAIASERPKPNDKNRRKPSSDRLEDALAELREATRRTYYDEVQDEQDRENYYSGLLDRADSLSADQLYRELNDLLTQTHDNQLSYKPSNQLYPWVDLHPDQKLRSIYSEQPFDAEELIREDFRIDQLRSLRTQELQLKESTLSPEQYAMELDLLEASLPFNCEHVVPQSWFAKKEPMRGDLHHLFACEPPCNSFRSNYPYFDFDDFEEREIIRDSCGKLSGSKFEPSKGKGAVARSTLYFLLRYPDEINKTDREYKKERIATLVDWHRRFPPSEYEKHRNAAIYEKQGNRNPLIDFPEWSEQINFSLGLG